MALLFENGDRIVFAGDSVTDMGSVQPVADAMFDNLGHSYVRIIENLLTASYPDVFLRITNSGTSGNTSRDLKNRFDRDVVNLNPQWVSICIGINDVWRQFDVPAMPEYACDPVEYEANLREMIEKIKDKVKGIFLITPYYIEPNRKDMMRARMDEYCAVCKKLAKEYDCIFVDFQQMFEDFCKIRHSSYLAWDRVHPNQIGATLMAREFLSHCGYKY